MPQPTTITFKQLSKIAEQLKELNNTGNSDKYYTLQDTFKSQLFDFIRSDFSNLKANQLLRLCGWVQTHRPCALHTFLIYCGNLAK